MRTRIRDAFSYEGATDLKHLIEAYWAKRGQVVKCRVKQLQFTIMHGKRSKKPGSMEQHYQAWVVESDMINGLPRGVYEAKSGDVRPEPLPVSTDHYLFC